MRQGRELDTAQSAPVPRSRLERYLEVESREMGGEYSRRRVQQHPRDSSEGGRVERSVFAGGQQQRGEALDVEHRGDLQRRRGNNQLLLRGQLILAAVVAVGAVVAGVVMAAYHHALDRHRGGRVAGAAGVVSLELAVAGSIAAVTAGGLIALMVVMVVMVMVVMVMLVVQRVRYSGRLGRRGAQSILVIQTRLLLLLLLQRRV